MKTTILSLLLLASAASPRPQPGLPFLLIWPTARSTALAGAMTGLADDPDAMFFNPAGLAFQPGIGATANYARWVPGVHSGMLYGYVAGTYALPIDSASGRTAVVGLEVAHLNCGRIYHYTEPPEYPEYAERTTAALSAALGLSEHLSAGLKVKYIHSKLVPDWVWKGLPGFGIEQGGTGSAWACDAGILWRPSNRLSVGATVVNLGPGITYTSSGEHDPSPIIVRLGACWTPVSSRYVRLNVLPELDKVLVGMFYDTTGRKAFRRQLTEEWRDVWKALGVEATMASVLSVRVGYFEDMTWDRGGFVFQKESREERYNLADLLTRKGLGRLKSIGLCWGFGIGYMDYFRFDVSSDAAIYDFPTSNWKFALTANDIAGGVRELKQGHWPWEG